jgi:hypothetical protein
MPAEAHVHLYGDDYLVELADGDVWVASVSCFCGTGACPSAPTAWHWHEVVRADDYRDLLVLLSARAVIDGAEAA